VIIGIDFDGTVVEDGGELRLKPGAKDALVSMKQAGHSLLLFSARANRALRENPKLDPLVRVGVRRVNQEAWQRSQPIYEHRYQEMLEFVGKELPGVFAAVDDGQQGKPLVDLFIDDRAYHFGADGFEWRELGIVLGGRHGKENA
jgi:hypothetical protein